MTFSLSKTHWHTWKLGGKMPCRRSTIPGSRMQLWTFFVDRTYQRDIKPVPALSCVGCVSIPFGRALAWHARGHRFDPGNLHTEALHEKSRSAFYFVSKQVYHDSPNTVQDQSWSSQECSGCSTYNRNIRRKVSGANQTQYAQNHWNLLKAFTERGRLIIMNVQISTSGCVLCVCGEKTDLPWKRDTWKYTGYHCKSFVNNGKYHLTLSNECAILLCVLPQKGGNRS